MKLSIVIPCYNESKDIESKTKIVQEKIANLPIETELILVNDGSKDNTGEIIKHIKGIIPCSYEKNRGKGGAVKEGITNSTGDYILFMDADLSTDLEALDKIVPILEDHDMIIGTRHHKNSILPVKQPVKRRIISWGCRKLVNFKFHSHYTDTQCGFKCIKADLAKKIIEKQTINGFAFDVEYLYIAKVNKKEIVELPVTWRDDRGSTVSPIKSSIAFFKDIFKIKRNKKKYIFTR